MSVIDTSLWLTLLPYGPPPKWKRNWILSLHKIGHLAIHSHTIVMSWPSISRANFITDRLFLHLFAQFVCSKISKREKAIKVIIFHTIDRFGFFRAMSWLISKPLFLQVLWKSSWSQRERPTAAHLKQLLSRSFIEQSQAPLYSFFLPFFLLVVVSLNLSTFVYTPLSSAILLNYEARFSISTFSLYSIWWHV